MDSKAHRSGFDYFCVIYFFLPASLPHLPKSSKLKAVQYLLSFLQFPHLPPPQRLFYSFSAFFFLSFHMSLPIIISVLKKTLDFIFIVPLCTCSITSLPSWVNRKSDLLTSAALGSTTYWEKKKNKHEGLYCRSLENKKSK